MRRICWGRPRYCLSCAKRNNGPVRGMMLAGCNVIIHPYAGDGNGRIHIRGDGCGQI